MSDPIAEAMARLAADAPLDADAIDLLLDAAYADGRLDRGDRRRLRALLHTHADRLTPEASERLDLIGRMQNATLRDAARRLAADGELSADDVAALAGLAGADDRISGRERTTLIAMLDLYAGILTTEARDALRALTGLESTGASQHPDADAPPAAELAPGLYRLPEGQLSTRSDAWPETFEQTGTALYRAAGLIDDLPADGRLFADDDADRQETLEAQLKSALELGHAPPEGSELRQANQLRASAHTCLVHLIECNPPRKRAVETAALHYARAESHPVLREAFAYALTRISGRMSPEGRDAAHALFAERVPTTPPYDGWFAGQEGTPTLVVHWSAGRGSEGFFKGTVELLEREGFSAEGEVTSVGPSWFRREFGDRLVVRVRLKEFESDVFATMDEPGVHIVGYDGHSDIGRNMRRALRRAPDQKGAKLVFYGLCAGKDALFRVRGRYPDAQVMTSFNSSYFRTADGGNGRRMVESENFNVLMAVLEGAADRADWKTIRRKIIDEAIPRYWKRHHALPEGYNYITPIDTGLRASVLDADRDGQADVLDRLVNFDPFDVAADTANEFTARDPGRPADDLDGTEVHIAANTVNTAVLYNPFTKKYNDTGRIVGGGYADMGPDDPIVRFDDIELDDEPAWCLVVNRHYAHMSEEGVRAAAMYGWIRHLAETDADLFRTRWRAATWQTAPERPDAADERLMALTLAMFTLTYDMNDGFAGLHRRDIEIWNNLLAHHDLPKLAHRPIWQLIWDEKHDYAGSPGIVNTWREGLDDDSIVALGGPSLVG